MGKCRKWMRSVAAAGVLFAVPAVFSGCETEKLEQFFGLNIPKEAKFMMSFHNEVKYPRGNSNIEQMVQMQDGSTRIVNVLPFMSSRNIVEISARPIPGKDGYYRLSLKPDQRGRTMWIQLSAQFRHTPAVLLIDGVYYADVQPTKISDGSEEWVELPVDFDSVMAHYLVKYANDNYRFFNDGASKDRSPFSKDRK